MAQCKLSSSRVVGVDGDGRRPKRTRATWIRRRRGFRLVFVSVVVQQTTDVFMDTTATREMVGGHSRVRRALMAALGNRSGGRGERVVER